MKGRDLRKSSVAFQRTSNYLKSVGNRSSS